MTANLPRKTDTVIVGAGQAGLTMSWWLRAAGRDHVLLFLGLLWQRNQGSATLFGVNEDAAYIARQMDLPAPANRPQLPIPD